MTRPSHITEQHIRRGAQMRAVVEHDIAQGTTFDESVKQLADYLGISRDAVRLAIAIANEWQPTRTLAA